MLFLELRGINTHSDIFFQCRLLSRLGCQWLPCSVAVSNVSQTKFPKMAIPSFFCVRHRETHVKFEGDNIQGEVISCLSVPTLYLVISHISKHLCDKLQEINLSYIFHVNKALTQLLRNDPLATHRPIMTFKSTIIFITAIRFSPAVLV